MIRECLLSASSTMQRLPAASRCESTAGDGNVVQFHAANLDVSGFSRENWCVLEPPDPLDVHWKGALRVFPSAWMACRELLDNAVDAAGPGRPVQVHLHQAGHLRGQEYVAITAVNQGDVVSPSQLERFCALHVSGKLGSEAAAGAVGKYGLGAKLAAIASAVHSGQDADVLLETFPDVKESRTEASFFHVVDRLQREAGALHIAAVNADGVAALLLASFSPALAKGSEGPDSCLLPLFPPRQVKLDLSLNGRADAPPLHSCCAVRVVVPGSTQDTLALLQDYVSALRVHPTAVFDHVTVHAGSTPLPALPAMALDCARTGLHEQLHEAAHLRTPSALAERFLGDSSLLDHTSSAAAGLLHGDGARCSAWAVLCPTATSPGSGTASGSQRNASQVKHEECIDEAELWVFRFANGRPLLRGAVGGAVEQALLAGVAWGDLGLQVLQGGPPCEDTQARSACELRGAVPSWKARLLPSAALPKGALRFHRLMLFVDLQAGTQGQPLAYSSLLKTSFSPRCALRPRRV